MRREPEKTPSVRYVTALVMPENKVMSQYVPRLQQLAATGIPLTCFLDVGFEDLALELEALDAVEVRLEQFVPIDLPEDITLPSGAQGGDTRRYLSIQLAKSGYCARVAAHCKEPIVAWIDARIFHVVAEADEVAVKDALEYLAHAPFPPSLRFLAPGGRYGGHVSPDYPCWRLLGGFLLGRRELWSAWDQMLQALVLQHLPRLMWEVNYWALIADDFETHLVPADHNASMIVDVAMWVHARAEEAKEELFNSGKGGKAALKCQ